MRFSTSTAATALIAAACIASPTFAGPEVTVVNTPAQPIPTTIQGTVSVTGTTTLNGTIGIDPARNTVRVDSDFFRPLFTVDSDRIERMPSRTEVRVWDVSGSNTAIFTLLFPPMPGWMPVVDLVSIRIATPPGATVAGMVNFTQFPNFQYQGVVQGSAIYVANVETRIAGDLAGVQPMQLALSITVDTSASPAPVQGDSSVVTAAARAHFVRLLQ